MTRPIAQKYCEGKVKSILKRRLKELEIVKRETHKAIDWGVGGSCWLLSCLALVGP